MRTIKGFLVLLRNPIVALTAGNPNFEPLNRRYRGLQRLPPYGTPETPMDDLECERRALEEYVFSPDYNDENGMIPDLEKAKRLLAMFRDSGSPREFEIIFAETSDTGDAALFYPSWEWLGYDVAGEAPFYSLLADFPPEPEMRSFFQQLNEAGLFDTARQANEFLSAYVSVKLPDWDVPYRVWRVFAVPLSFEGTE